MGDEALLTAVQAFYNGVYSKSIPDVLHVLDPKIDWWVFGPQGNLINGHYVGHEEVTRFFVRLNTVFNVTHFQAREFYPSASTRTVTVLGKEEGVVQETGNDATFDKEWANKPFHNRFVHVFWFNEEGKVYKFRANFTQFDEDFPYDDKL